MRAEPVVPDRVIDTVETMILTITNPAVERHERSWAEFTARATIEALRRLPIEQRLEVVGIGYEQVTEYGVRLSDET